MPSSNPPVVLIAEDDPVFRHLLQFTIERSGYTVFVTSDGEMAWERLQERDVDLLITDQQMPKCTGIDLLLRIAKDQIDSASDNRRNLVAAAVLCTAKGLEIDRQRLKDQFGLLEVMGKPFSPKQLTRLIDEFFQNRSQAALEATSDCGTASCGKTPPGNALSAQTKPRTVWNACHAN